MMNFDFTSLKIFAACSTAKKAAEILAHEIELDTGVRPEISETKETPCVAFALDESIKCKDSYRIDFCPEALSLTLFANGIRGLIFAAGMFLRRTERKNSKILLIENIAGNYEPDMKIRGHQLGYRPTPNSYDAWSIENYRRYYIDLMFFGCNIVEHIPYEQPSPQRNSLMKYDAEDLLVEASAVAEEYDLDVSLWYPNCDEETEEEALERRKNLFKRSPRINVVFPPGGDPGDMGAEDFVERCRKISNVLKEIHPNAEMWPSAQMPKAQINWGPIFVEEMEKLPKEITGVITGPNRAFTLEQLRRRLPAEYPIRLYPDITHNVRCEYPVHFNRDDWHFALTTGLSRECINPRPSEYRLIHRLTRRYIIGSVSYSEGVSDDINKFVWSDMDYNRNVDLNDTLNDYSRLFFPALPSQRVADGIFALELNWATDPAENPGIENTLEIWEGLSKSYPEINKNWRFIQCLFRAKCDALLRRRRCFELKLIKEAKPFLAAGNLERGQKILETAFPEDYVALREELEVHGKFLFETIGLQLDVERYGASGWERGATFDTIDLPITNKAWLLNRLNHAKALPENERQGFVERVLNRNIVAGDEYYFSVAEHGLEVLDSTQKGEMYMNFQGDRPNVNNGSMPTEMFKVYDNVSLRCKLGGFAPNTDYKLRVTFKCDKISILKDHHVIANGVTVYSGKQFGGEKNEIFDAELLAPGFETATYTIPAEVFKNGCVELEIGEPYMGVYLCEFWLLKA